MSTATQELTRRELRSRRVTPIDSVDLAPLSAREAIGRSTGMRGVPLAPSRPPLWKSAGVVGLIAVIAAGSLPLAASALDIPL
ncbi:hypothetical protein ACIP5T_10615 [Microbacterium sp. NPDC088619]|uniref:hypothetical protein n=1 Tax=Microbacterium sp. NPDC088619 TaxID=3364196 RepID=UPI003827A405